MRLARNMTAAMANSVVVVLINVVALPFYLRYLGMEAYGLIGFYATLQTVIQLLDLGLAPTVSREIAHDAETGRQRRAASLLRTLGVVYVFVAITIAGLVALAAPWISGQWLQARALSPETVAQAVTLMGINVACRWPIGLYTGALAGSQRLARASVTSMTINTLATLTSIAVLAWVARSVQAFFLVQAGFGLLQAIVLGVLARSALGEKDAPFDWAGLRRVWGFSAWMSGIAITSLVFTQFDKVLLSRLVTLDAFGQYMLAVLLVSGLQVVVGPAFQVIYPKFTALVARGDQGGLARFYSSTSRIYAGMVFSLALALALHVESLVTLWTGSVGIARDVAPLVLLLATGSALNGVMYYPYALQLANGKPRIAFSINITLLLVGAPTILWLVTNYGAVGGAMAWAALGLVYVIVGTLATGAKVAPFAGVRWLARDIAVPLGLAFVPAVAGAWLSRSLALSPWPASGLAVLAACTGIACGALYSPFARQRVVALLGGRACPCPN